MSNKTIYLKDYQAPVYSIENIELNFDLYDDHALVTSQLRITREAPGPLFLHGEELELVSIVLNDNPLASGAYRFDDENLIIDDCPTQANLSIVTRIYPQKNTQLSGLYRSNHLFCTQCEAEGFRRMTYYPDRPDVLSTFTTRITADKSKYPVLLSNGNLIEKGDGPDNRHWVIWQDPFKKPSYLFALVAGQLACVSDQFRTQSGRTIDLHIYIEPGNEDKCAHAMASLKRAMQWDEEVYGREYDLDIFMIVAVSDFNMGAMENKGLNIFNSKYILARPDTATDQDFVDIESVVAHEYFHNWTGNRITCRDWFQLSLKEGLTVFRDQEFSRDMHSRDVNRILDVKGLRGAQFPEDASSMAHPVRPESYQEINNFYTATIYEKGAEVIRMQHTLLGAEGFRKGMDLYFDRHDGQAVTIDDFVAAMEDANGVDFTQFKSWYSQAGTPNLYVETAFDNGRLTVTFKQSCPPTPEAVEKKPFHIPVRIALLGRDGQFYPLDNEVLEIKEPEQSFYFDDLPEQPVLSLLRDFSAPVNLHYPMSMEDCLTVLRYETNGYAKWNMAHFLATTCMHEWLKKSPQEWTIPQPLLEAYRHILFDESHDPALRAELLTPPGFQEVIASLTEVDVDAVEQVRDAFRSQLGSYLYEEAAPIYQELWMEEEHAMSSEAYGWRKLRNACLWLMMRSKPQEALPYCLEQFEKAETMTDQLASFALLMDVGQGVGQQACDAFYQQWQSDDLVLDKWFAVQASSELPSSLATVKQLLKHPAFSLKNPNKVRSLVGVFCMANPRNFHAKDGSGYRFLAEMLLEMDRLNPQIAARLATPFTRWQRFDLQRQALMKEQLKRLAQEKLSKDLAELVEKSLVG